jgi:hypothetical protein
MTSFDPTLIFGADPLTPTWKIVRGDTARLRVMFLETDEATAYDTADWQYTSSVYDFKGEVLDELTVTAGTGYVDILATAQTTSTWGAGYSSNVAKLAFDLEIVLPDGDVWTPIIGTINVIGDVSPNP